MEKQFISVADVWHRGIDIPVIVTAVEEKGIYYFDRFGRYKKADPANCLNGLEFLWDWKNGDCSGPVIDPESGDVLHDPSAQLEDFGWYEEDEPKWGGIPSGNKVPPQANRTANNLLRLIKVLCEHGGIRWESCKPSELVLLMEKTEHEPLSDDTLRKYLKMMRD
jgi:hypothetical protein